MRLKVTWLFEGPGPDEVLVSVSTASGKEELVVSKAALQDDTIDVGQPIKSRPKELLIELPREAMSGKWRVWVPENIVLA